jgi:hypothetical protein
MDSNAVRANLQLALAVYAETLAERGHVLVIGDSSLGLGELLIRLGARAVEVWDPEGARARVEAERAPRGVTVRALSRDQPEVRDVDLVVLPDLGSLPEPTDTLARVRRMLGDEGTAVVSAANAANADVAPGSSAFDYYELFDLVAKEFDCVRMIAQLPFYGVTLAELGDEDDSPAVSVDTQLADAGRSADAFIALASQRDVRLDAYSIVELPLPPPLPPQISRASLEDAELRAKSLEAQLAVVLADRARQVTSLASEVEELRATVEAARVAALAAEEFALRADQAEGRAALLEQELLRADAQPEEHLRYEEALRERAGRVRALEAEIERRDQMVRELAGALEDAAVEARRAPDTSVEEGADARDEENARLRERLDVLALELARREGEAHASVWKLAELERRLAQEAAPAEEDAGQDASLAAALDEADALRRALVQEHEARLRAESARESGDETRDALGAAPLADENTR